MDLQNAYHQVVKDFKKQLVRKEEIK